MTRPFDSAVTELVPPLPTATGTLRDTVEYPPTVEMTIPVPGRLLISPVFCSVIEPDALVTEIPVAAVSVAATGTAPDAPINN